MLLASPPAPPRPPPVGPLALVNAALESTGELPPGVWTEWLWGTNPEEALTPSVLVNRNQLLGLLVCRHQCQAPRGPSVAFVNPCMAITPTQPRDMTLRELRDTLDNMCVEWPRHHGRDSGSELSAVVQYVEALLSRLGALAGGGGDTTVLNDASCVEDVASSAVAGSAVAGSARLLRLTRPCLRRMLATLLMLYRHLHLLAAARVVPPVPYDCGLGKHHMEASTDDYSQLCMRMVIPVGSALVYKQDFAGMFNHISQVVYLHQPDYQRPMRVGLEEAQRDGEAMQVLPALMQLFPDIRVYYEEDHLDLSKPLGHWAWVVVPSKVYLVDPGSGVHHSTNVTSLVGVYAAAVQSPPT